MPDTVLIADDDPVQRRLVESMVQRFGYEALTADGGDAALRMLIGDDAKPVDCLILDLVMPDLDGLGVLARLRDAGADIPVIMQTAHGGIDNVVSAMRAGATDFVVKPLSPERLQVSIENALKLVALEGELARIKRTASGTLTFAPGDTTKQIPVSVVPDTTAEPTEIFVVRLSSAANATITDNSATVRITLLICVVPARM